MVRPDHVFPVKQYMKTWCIFDVVLMVSEWFAQIMSSQSNASVVRVTRVMGYIRCSRLLRLVKIPNVWKLVEDQFSTHLQQLAFSAIKTIIAFCILVHLITCAWYAIGVESPTGWTSYDVAAREDNSLLFWYFASSRWVLAQINGRTDIDDRRNMQERLFTCLVSVAFAVLFMSVFLSSITASLLELSAFSEEKNSARRSVNEYLEHHRVSFSLAASIKAHLADRESLKTLQTEEERERFVLAQLPDNLQFDLLYEARAPVLAWHEFFREMDRGFSRVLRHISCTALQSLLAHRHEELFAKGDACSRMLFVSKGRLTYSMSDAAARSCSESRPIVIIRQSLGSVASAEAGVGSTSLAQRLRPGMWLGEAALWIEWSCQGRLLTDTDCALFALEATQLAQALSGYRDVYAMTALYARRFLDGLQRQDEPSDLMKVVIDVQAPNPGRHVA